MVKFRAAWMTALAIFATCAAAEATDTVEELKARIEALERELAEARASLEASLGASPGAAAEAVSEPALEAPRQDARGEAPAADAPLADGQRLPRFLKEWKSSVEFGLNGTEGNSSRQSLRLSFNTVRRTSAHETVLKGAYRLTSENGQTRQNQLVLDARQDWLTLKHDKWRYFVTARYELDEFQDWDARVSGFGGVGFELIGTEKTSLLGRGGFGASRRIGVADDDVRSEGFLAADLSHTLSPRQTLRAGVEYLPDTAEPGTFRLNSDASWEVRIDPAAELYLRVGVANRYDSKPGGNAHESDVDYFVNLGWSF